MSRGHADRGLATLDRGVAGLGGEGPRGGSPLVRLAPVDSVSDPGRLEPGRRAAVGAAPP